jgi:hypothetical protein
MTLPVPVNVSTLPANVAGPAKTEKLTWRPDVAVAVKVSAGPGNRAVAGGMNVIVCGWRAVKVAVTVLFALFIATVVAALVGLATGSPVQRIKA